MKKGFQPKQFGFPRLSDRYPAEWSDLPSELKLECVQYLTVKDKLMLRSTSRSNKSLIESQKIHCDEICIYGIAGLHLNAIIITPAEIHSPAIYFNIDNEIEKIEKHKVNPVDHLLDLFTRIGRVDGWTVSETEKLENSEEIHRKMYNVEATGWCPFDELLTIPLIIRSKNFEFRAIHKVDMLINFIEKWVENDVFYDVDFRFSINKNGHDENFISELIESKFEERIHNKTNTRIRIKAKAANKLILVNRQLLSHGDYWECRIVSPRMTDYAYNEKFKDQQWAERLDRFLFEI